MTALEVRERGPDPMARVTVGGRAAASAGLVRGLRICDFTGGLARRVQLSAGTRPVGEPMGYLADSFIPRGEWRSPTPQELSVLEKRVRPSRWSRLGPFVVSVVRVPGLLAAPIRREACDAAASEHDWRRFEATSAYRHAVEGELLETARPYHWGTGPLRPLGMFRKEAGLISCGYVRQLSKYVGLHFDSYELYPLSQRHHSQNRLCVNLGTTPRHLLMINLSMLQIFKLLKLEWTVDVDRRPWGGFLTREFMSRFPDYPVVRLRLDPGEAYIASTEQALHDGSTELSSAPDVSLQFLGRFVGASRAA